MSSGNTCSICCHVYNEGKNRPLVLPCSHSFCQDCLQKMEAAGDALCPLCRTSWSSNPVKGLPFCHQLIPENNCVLNKKTLICNHQLTPGEMCDEHDMELMFWCKSCKILICIKCVCQTHKKCDWCLLEDIRETAKVEYTDTLIRAINFMSRNQEDLSVVRYMIEKLQEQEKGLMSNKISLEEWHKRNGDLDSSDFTNINKVELMQQKMDAVDDDIMKEYFQPSPVLMRIAHTFKTTVDGDADAFADNFKKIHEDFTSNRETPSPVLHVDANTNVNKPQHTLKDGEVWTIPNEEVARAAMDAMLNLSMRPSLVTISWCDWTYKQMRDLLSVFVDSKHEIELKFIDHFLNPSAVSSTLGTAVGDVSKRCHLTQFWGHLNMLDELPETVRIFGQALKCQEDCSVLNSMYKTRHPRSKFSLPYPVLPMLSEIHLCFEKSFKPEDWNVNDNWQAWGFRKNKSFALHFPRLEASDVPWAAAVTQSITQDFQFIHTVDDLYLPEASLGVDDVLGLVEACPGLRCAVHLPACRMPAARSKISKQFQKRACQVTWDIEPDSVHPWN